MTTPTGTQDWLKPVPGGARALFNANVNLQAAGGIFSTPWLKCTAFSGLFLEAVGFTNNAADFNTLQVRFRDPTTGLLIKPVYNVVWRGDLPTAINIPVLGAEVQVVVTGPLVNVNAPMCLTGHGGGGSPGHGFAADVLAGRELSNIAGNAAFTDDTGIVREGPATLTADFDASSGFMEVRSFAFDGTFRPLAILRLQAAVAQTVALWIPPRPTQVFFSNSTAAAANIRYSLTMGRA